MLQKLLLLDPRPRGNTPNPFDTIFPFINTSNVRNVQLLTNIPSKSDLTPTDGSIVVCWDREGLWGDSNSPVPNNHTILSKLSSMYSVRTTNYPVKGKTIYVYKHSGNPLKIYTN